MLKIAFYTLGCKVNQYETQIMQNQFENEGYEIVKFQDNADIYIVNSCTVTSSGDKKTFSLLRKIRREHENAIIALTGCFPQAFPDEARNIAEADIVQGSYNRKALLLNVQKFTKDKIRIVDITKHKPNEPFEPMQVSSFSQHTRAFVKIEDGCDRYCSYCIIPKARGPIRSKPLISIINEVTDLVKNGYKEIVLVGINLSSYGKEITTIRLIDAIEAVCEIKGVMRVRLGSLEPELLTDDDLKRMAKQAKFCSQFHLSLQSGCTKTLQRMNRHYSADEYFDIVVRIRRYFDNPSITTDIMVGFAGEDDEEFMQSLEFAKKVQFAKTHVFPYSIREGTKAALMPNQVDHIKKEHRSHIMIEETKKLHISFLNQQIHKISEVLFEREISQNLFEGYTKNYARVVVSSNDNLSGLIKPVLINAVKDDYCTGKIIK